MNKIAENYASKNIGAIFIYTHEAHPGENYPHLTSMGQKNTHAKAFRDILGVTRPILLDALDGACHRNFGSMPNMTWIFNRFAIPVYKSDWSDADSVRNALDYFIMVGQKKKEGKRMAPFSVERLDYRESDRNAFYERLAVNGPKAVDEFRRTFGN